MSFDLSNIGFPTVESESDYWKATRKSKKPLNNIGFDMGLQNLSWGNQSDNINSNVWNYNDPFGFSGKPKQFRKVKGKRVMVTPKQKQMSGFDMLNFFPTQPKQKPQTKKSAKSSEIINRPKNYRPIAKTDNVLINTISTLNERLSRRSEQKRFEKSQPYAKPPQDTKNTYVVSGTDDKGRGFTERYNSPNVAYASEQRYKAKGYQVNTINISGKGKPKKVAGRIPTRLEILSDESLLSDEL